MTERTWSRIAAATAVGLIAVAGSGAQDPEPRRQPTSAAAGSSAASRSDPQQAALQQVPEPDLSPLEPAVADQLTAVRGTAEAVIGDPGKPAAERSDAYGDLGRVYHAYGLLEPARVAYRNAEALAPGDFRWPYYLGLLHQERGEHEAAGAAYDRVLELLPHALPALVHRGEVALALDRPDEAEDYLLRALSTEPASPSVRAVLGQVALSRRDYRRAAELLEAALEALPAANRLHYPLALAYRGLGDEARAREHMALRGEVGARPPDPLLDELEALKQGERVHVVRGATAFRAGRYAEATEAFGAAVMANPKSIPARVNLAAALSALGRTEQAARELRMAIEIEPRNPTAHYNLGLLLGSAGDSAGAVRELAAAIEAAPRDAGMRLAYARALAAAGRNEEALASFRIAVQMDPLSSAARLGEAQTLVRLDRYAEARSRLEEATATFPEDPAVALGLAKLLAAAPDPAVRDGGLAVELAQRVHEAGPTDRTAETLALALAESGRCAEAAELQQQAADVVAAAGDEGRAAELATAAEGYRAGPPCRPAVGESAAGADSGTAADAESPDAG